MLEEEKFFRTPEAPEEAPVAAFERIVVLAPFGRDRKVLASLLGKQGFTVIAGDTCPAGLLDVLRQGADVVLLTAEAFRTQILDLLSAHFHSEPVWSIPPVILVAENRASAQAISSTLRSVRPDLAVTILIRPCAEIEITSAVGAAVETRRQQGRIRDLITRHERAEKQANFLFRELSHRVQNLFNMVSAIADQTSKAAPDSQAFREMFRGRITALANTYTLLKDGDWQGAELGEVIASSVDPLLAPGEEHRVVTQGPRVTLSSNLASSLGMIMHELAANARKYGALSGNCGQVEVDWRFTEAKRIIVEWKERGGPPVTPPSTQGFGTAVITRSLSGVSDGEVELSYRPEGAFCRIAFRQETGPAP